MNTITFVPFNQIRAEQLLPIVNDPTVRKHLIDHEIFTVQGLNQWITNKLALDSRDDCRIRAIYSDGVLAGWCGIQPDYNGVELAMVLSPKYWGLGANIFQTVIGWAKELGHQEVQLHLLDSRPDYKALLKRSTRVYKTKRLGRCFTSYAIAVTAQAIPFE